MVEHELKCWPNFFRAIREGRKTFEIRKNDRGFQTGDILRLREYNPPGNGLMGDGYTGQRLRRRVLYVLSGWGLEPGYVCMALAPGEVLDE